MSYRDDRDADRARIDALEHELATARTKISELEGSDDATALVPVGGGGEAQSRALALIAPGDSRVAKILGARNHLELSRTWAAALASDYFDEVIAEIRARSRDPGRAEVLKLSMTWRSTRMANRSGSAAREIAVVVRDGKTTLTVSERLDAVAASAFGGTSVATMSGGLAMSGFIVMAAPWLLPVALALWLGGNFMVARTLFKRGARKRAIELQDIFDVLVADITRQLAVAVAASPPAADPPR